LLVKERWRKQGFAQPQSGLPNLSAFRELRAGRSGSTIPDRGDIGEPSEWASKELKKLVSYLASDNRPARVAFLATAKLSVMFIKCNDHLMTIA
jgi:hypothetical protein